MSLARYLSKLGAMLGSDGKVPASALAAGAARANFGAGAVLQVVQTVKSDTWSASVSDGSWSSVTGTNFYDVTGLSATITPSSTNSKILVLVNMYASTSMNGWNTHWLLRDASNNVVLKGNPNGGQEGVTADFRGWDSGAASANQYNLNVKALLSPNTTSPVTYKMAGRGTTNQTIYVNRGGRDTANGQDDSRTVSTITLLEIAG